MKMKMVMLVILIVVLIGTTPNAEGTRKKLMGRRSSSPVHINHTTTPIAKIIYFFKFNDEERVVPTGPNPLHNR
ncbi:hypothetical protein Hanom_Chr17g01536801 [Helianthus anomalus]